MSWLEVAMLAALLVGIACGGVLLANHAAFWESLGARALTALWPQFLKLVPVITAWLAKRNTPEIEAKMAECVRRGGEWDNFRKKCRNR
jgi:hypothetical protein